MLNQELVQIPQSFAQLVQDLDRDTKRYLSDILAQEHTTGDELIRNLIRNHWLLLNQHLALESTQLETAQQTTQSEIRPTQLDQIEPGFASDLALVSLAASSTDNSTVMTAASLPESPPAIAYAAAHKPRNSKQVIAEFVRRKNQRSWSF